ncbi:hypothetical protein V6N13_117963 [Hibiscus sabdariffa]
MEGSGLSGPIPSINAPLQSLRYIIIRDLNRADAAFPLFNASLPSLDRVILRSCNPIGEIPTSLREFRSIKILDLSFNRLSGEIPDLFFILVWIHFPSWILGTREDADVSYNNFTSTGGESNCGRNPRLNLFSSILRTNNFTIRKVNCLASWLLPTSHGTIEKIPEPKLASCSFLPTGSASCPILHPNILILGKTGSLAKAFMENSGPSHSDQNTFCHLSDLHVVSGGKRLRRRSKLSILFSCRPRHRATSVLSIATTT